MFIKQRNLGFTLIELIIFIVVVGAALAGLLRVVNGVVQNSADPVVHKQSLAIAESLLEEILQKDFANPVGGYAGVNRNQFDDVADYNGYATAGGIVDAVGNPILGLGNYNITPAVAVVAIPNWNGIAALQVTVTVTGPGGAMTLVGFRSNN